MAAWYRIWVTWVHSVSGRILLTSSGTTIVSPGRISIPPLRPNHFERFVVTTAPLARPRLRYGYLPYRYNNYRRGLNYYFYFPYWNYRGIY